MVKALSSIFAAMAVGLVYVSTPLVVSADVDDSDIARSAIGRTSVSSSVGNAATSSVSRVTPKSSSDAQKDSQIRSSVSRSIPAVASVSAAQSFGGNQAIISRGAVNAQISGDDKISRSATDSVSRTAVSRSAAAASMQNENTRSEYEQFHSNDKGIMDQNAVIRRAGVSLRPSTAEVGGRAIISGTNSMTGSNFEPGKSAVSQRAARAATESATTTATTSATNAISAMEETAAKTKSCQEQYTDCLDQFCNVIDSNQKRCSCSSRLSNYSKVESAVKDANEQLNDVAQRIRYIGLSADEITAIMSATEAELALQNTTDNTESRSMLDDIAKLIEDPGTFVAEANNVTSLDFGDVIDFSDTSSTDDLFNLDLNGTTSFSNMRGTDLYNAAKSKCKTILNTCKKSGATTDQISARYDMDIDKDCIDYEKGLDKMNTTLKNNVRSAKNMLEKARLAVLQNQNQYDTKGCIGALDACMKDDMVCGDNYYKCLDPTKTYIDENGEVILGKDITNIRRMMTEYNNSSITGSFLDTARGTTMTEDICTSDGHNDGSCNVKYLLDKIGTNTNTGLCRVVLDKCRRSTYDDSGDYIEDNEVVINYIQRAMVNIKAAQEVIISDYASSCMLDIANCYNQQVSQVNSWSTVASINSIYRVMTGACRNVALTCSYAVFADATEDNVRLCDGSTAEGQANCIQNISEMFYQSLLCPDNSTYVTTNGTIGSWNADNRQYVNEQCLCMDGYVASSGSCSVCPYNSTFVGGVGETGTICTITSTGEAGCVSKGCRCDTGYQPSNGYCIAVE